MSPSEEAKQIASTFLKYVIKGSESIFDRTKREIKKPNQALQRTGTAACGVGPSR